MEKIAEFVPVRIVPLENGVAELIPTTRSVRQFVRQVEWQAHRTRGENRPLVPFEALPSLVTHAKAERVARGETIRVNVPSRALLEVLGA